MSISGRYRPFTIVFYGTQLELMGIIRTYRARIAHYAFIPHDKDIYDEDLYDEKKETLIHKKGDIAKQHIHLLVDFFNGHTITAVKRLFTTDNDKPRVDVVRDRAAQYRYLTHKDNPEKYQYNTADIISEDINYYEKICIVGDKVDGDNKAEMIINDLLRGVSPRIMVSRYGRDFVIHMKQYQECANEIRYYEADEHIRQKILADENAKKIENEQLQCPFDD